MKKFVLKNLLPKGLVKKTVLDLLAKNVDKLDLADLAFNAVLASIKNPLLAALVNCLQDALFELIKKEIKEHANEG